MKKKDIVHPKLYFKYDIVDHEIQLSYYSNQLDDSGDRLVKIIFLNQDSFSYMEMYKLNEREYHNLNLYIERQERIMSTYLKKGFKDQFNIVKTSVNLMYAFRDEFDKWFSKFKLDVNV